MKKTWDDLLKPMEPLGENEITVSMAKNKLGITSDKTALRRLSDLEKTGAIAFVGERKLPDGRKAKAWKVV